MTLRLSPQAHAALVDLRATPAEHGLFAAAARMLAALDDPACAAARRERWQTPWGDVSAVPIPTDHRWLAVWRHDDGAVAVLYLGPEHDAAPA
jgi:hypothetical protein